MVKTEIEKFIASKDVTVVEAMKLIDINTHGIIYIADENRKLTGSLSDGDIRRWIIRTGDLNGKAELMMNRNPKSVFESERRSGASFMKSSKIHSVPVVDEQLRIVDILFDDETEASEVSSSGLAGTPVIIMAGGKGTRLYPYTKILPKPLIPIGDIPILERIINRFTRCGANDFYLTVNYKKEMIKSYFKELAPSYDITYVEESKPLGTAGSIKLIEKKFDRSVIITNCDILIEADYEKVLAYHNESGNALTIVSSLKNVTIPYGVLHSSENGIISSMEEKPQLSYFINTGMYVLDPQYIEKIPDDTFYHMTHLADQLMSDGLKVGMYPISENSFLDMGEFEEMKKMEERINSGSVS
ncbi:MAG: nucleotidyltransferase family protein [Ruminococcus sp.]|nr:nucleotidyltransferase family protein [Ruminococcus sp.]